MTGLETGKSITLEKRAYFLRPAIEASRWQLSLTEPPAQQVRIHLVQLTSERQEAGAAVNLKYQTKMKKT